MFLLDTDIIIYALKGVPHVVENLYRHAADPKAISVITYGEMIFGAYTSERVVENLAKVRQLGALFPIVDLTPAIIETFGMIKADLRGQGTPLQDFDLLIGATALNMGYAVVTNNERHFSRIPGVTVVNWARQSEQER